MSNVGSGRREVVIYGRIDQTVIDGLERWGVGGRKNKNKKLAVSMARHGTARVCTVATRHAASASSGHRYGRAVGVTYGVFLEIA